MSQSIHLICNAHLDPVWLWQREEGVAEALSTFETAARFCRETDGFVFNHNEAVLYQWIEQYDPALFREIQRLVAAGKWHIMGGWYLQPDCNMPSGESFVRQVLEGRSYFREKFGAEPTTAINFDPFGHSRGLVQILAKSGYDSYIVCRPGQADFPLKENTFLWEGYDGSRILVHRLLNGYESGKGRARMKIEKYQSENTDGPTGLLLWGIGNHGGGPSAEDLAAIGEMMENGEALIHSTPETYFAALRESKEHFEVVSRPMNHWGVGCYTSQIRVKQAHRRLEGAYYALEKMAAHAAAIGAHPYPKKELAEIRKDLLFLEFHDILPGTAIRRAEDDALRLAGHALEQVSRTRLDVFLSMTYGRVSPTSSITPLYLYNPHPYPVEQTFTYELPLAQTVREGFAQPVLVRDGEPLPVQREQEENMVPIQWRRRIAFRARVKPMSMERLEFTYQVLEQPPSSGAIEEDGEFLRFSSGRVEAAINRRTGLLDSYRIDGTEYLRPGSFLPAVFEDIHDTWGMTLQKYDVPAGCFHLRRDGQGNPLLRVIEDGPVRVVVEGVFEYGRSELVLRYKLPCLDTELETEAFLQFAEDLKVVKLAVRPAFSGFRFLGETAFGVEELACDGQEEVAQKWLAADSGERCLTLINDSVYGSSCSSGTLYQTLIKSCGYSAHPMPGRPHVLSGRYLQNSDHTCVTYRFFLNGGESGQRLAAVSREAQIRCEEPALLACFSGNCPNSRESFWSLDGDCLVCSAVKAACDGEGWILRLFNPTGEPQKDLLRTGGFAFPVSAAPWEVKTFRWRPGANHLEEDNLLEQPIE